MFAVLRTRGKVHSLPCGLRRLPLKLLMSRRSRARASITLSVLAVLTGLAVAPPSQAKDYPLWEAGVGATALRLPDYRGSDESRNYLFPLPYFVYRGKLLQVDRRGATGVLLRGERTELDLSLSGSNPVRSSENRARSGMPDLDPTLEAGPRLTWRLAGGRLSDHELTLQLPIRAVIAVDLPIKSIGVLSNPVLNLDLRNLGPGGGWNLGIQGGPLFADRTYHRYYYQVDPQYARADRPAYTARGGYSGSQFTFALSKRFTKVWAGAFVRANALYGSAQEDSPLVKQKTTFLAGIGIAWIFAESSTRVEADE